MSNVLASLELDTTRFAREHDLRIEPNAADAQLCPVSAPRQWSGNMGVSNGVHYVQCGYPSGRCTCNNMPPQEPTTANANTCDKCGAPALEGTNHCAQHAKGLTTRMKPELQSMYVDGKRVHARPAAPVTVLRARYVCYCLNPSTSGHSGACKSLNESRTR